MKLWSGDVCIDVVDEYIPWAAAHCQAKSHIDAIFCNFQVDELTGVASMKVASPDVPMSKLNHFVATMKVPMSLTSEKACESSFEAFYLERGQCPLPTESKGNCSMDILVQSRGLPQTAVAFQTMRNRLSEYADRETGEIISELGQCK